MTRLGMRAAPKHHRIPLPTPGSGQEVLQVRCQQRHAHPHDAHRNPLPRVMPHLTVARKCCRSILMSTKTYMQGTRVTSTGTRQEWP